MAIWLPRRRSNSRRRRSNAVICSAVSVCVKSVTGARNGGTSTCASAVPSSSVSKTPPNRTHSRVTVDLRSTRRIRRRALHRGCFGEIHRGRTGNLGFVLDREVLFLLEAEQLGRQIRRKRAHGHVVVLHCVDIALACNRNAILR